MRAQLLARETPCDKYCWARVRVVGVALDDAHESLQGEIRVAFLSRGAGVADGESTFYLAPYNEYHPNRLWRLAEDAKGARLVPTDVQAARVWSHFLLGGEMGGLPEATSLPFTFRTTGPEHRCRGEVERQEHLKEWRTCFFKQEEMFAEGSAWFDDKQARQGLSSTPPRLQALAKTITTPGSWTQVSWEHSGIHWTLLLLVQQIGSRKLVSAALADVTLDAKGVSERERRASYARMMHAIDAGDASTVRRLINTGYPAQERGSEEFPGDTALDRAATKGDLAIVDVLLKARANPNACCCSCVTALHRAIKEGHTTVVRRLLESGGDPTIPYDGRMPTLELARKGGDPEIIRLIEEKLARTQR